MSSAAKTWTHITSNLQVRPLPSQAKKNALLDIYKKKKNKKKNFTWYGVGGYS